MSIANVTEPLHRGQKLNWNYPINLIGEKVTDPVIHICEVCDLPILIYGRILPCKHVFCHDCSSKAEKQCPRCKDPVNRIERCELGTIFLCTWGAPRHSHEGCRRTYLSQRDLQAHVNHRHASQKPTSATAGSLNSPPTAPMVNVAQHGRDAVGSASINPLQSDQSAMSAQQAAHIRQQLTQQQQIQQRQNMRNNLITIPLQQSDNSSRIDRRQRQPFR